MIRRRRQAAIVSWLATSALACRGTEGTLLFLDGGGPPISSVEAGKSSPPPRSAKSWQIQLSGTVDASFDVAMYEIDPFSSRSAVAELHASGRTVACFISAGTWEPWRDDAAQFSPSALGR